MTTTYTVRAMLGYLAATTAWLLARAGTPTEALCFVIGVAVILAVSPIRRAVLRQIALAEFARDAEIARLAAKRAYAYTTYQRPATRRASLVGGNASWLQ